MCGIIHAKKTDITQSARNLVLKRYEKQKTRGRDGYGYIEIRDGIVCAEVRTQTEEEILKRLAESTADEIMFHHRYPTSTPNITESTHPIKVSHPKLQYDYYVMHNGIITNDGSLRDKHVKDGYVYVTDITKKFITSQNVYSETMWNDSEAVAIDFVEAIEGDTAMTAQGSIAIVALQYDKVTKKVIGLHYGRNEGNPLCVEQKQNFFSLSSETGEAILSDVLYSRNYETGEITSHSKKIGVWFEPTYGRIDAWRDIMPMGYDGHKGYEDVEEDDFDVEMWEEVCALEDEIATANASGNYDLAQELETELEELKIEIDAINRTGQRGNYMRP